MQFFLSIALLLTSALAAPTSILPKRTGFLPFTYSVSNDVSGAHASATFFTDGHVRRVHDQFAGTALDRNGTIIATSAQSLTHLPAGIACQVYNTGGQDTVGEFTETTTYLDLDGQPKAVETDVTGFLIRCDIYVVN